MEASERFCLQTSSNHSYIHTISVQFNNINLNFFNDFNFISAFRFETIWKTIHRNDNAINSQFVGFGGNLYDDALEHAYWEYNPFNWTIKMEICLIAVIMSLSLRIQDIWWMPQIVIFKIGISYDLHFSFRFDECVRWTYHLQESKIVYSYIDATH